MRGVAAPYPPAPTGERAKTLGAFYTPGTAVAFMVHWAVARPDFRVIDPSFGDGIFLKAAGARVDYPQRQLYGIEFDEATFRAHRNLLTEHHHLSGDNLWNGDFFDADAFLPAEAFEAVVGNPPFIRYQKFGGAARARALGRALESGVALPGHASSWAPFLVYAASLVKPGGRLAMIAPAELGHAAYATKVLAFLLEQFATLNILSFRKRLFPRLSEDAFIVLGEHKGRPAAHLNLVDVESETELHRCTRELAAVGAVTPLGEKDITDLKGGKTRLLEYLLETETRALYRQLASHKRVKRFGTLARVGIGYVTGNNTFFHLSHREVEAFGIPRAYLTPCVRRGNDLPGLYLTHKDWSNMTEAKRWLLEIPASEPFESLPRPLRTYLEGGEARGVRGGFKVGQRKAWYAVPHVRRGVALLTYMAHDGPRLVHNPAAMPAPNTLHTVELPETHGDDALGELDIRLLVVSWYTSLTFLSAELEGHSLGGGLLKLEPGEAKKVRLALLPGSLEPEARNRAYRRIDRALRRNDLGAALDVGDALILQRGLGCSPEQCSVLRSGYLYLRGRRTSR